MYILSIKSNVRNKKTRRQFWFDLLKVKVSDTDEKEQVIESAYLKYVKMHDYQFVLKMPFDS